LPDNRRETRVNRRIRGSTGSRHPAPFDAVLATPFGKLGIRTEAEMLAEIAFLPDSTGPYTPVRPLARRACAQVERYLLDPDFHFSLPLKILGTGFQCRVWDAIAAIPRGGTRSYGEIARDLGSAPRAVGQACGQNRFPLVIPCHRVVAAGGIGGFAHEDGGYLLRIKRWLLAHEGAGISARR
jgi:methylated-DNA-[protein]-cysteine S-methyltransferase